MDIQWINSGISRKGFDWKAGKVVDSVTGQLDEVVIGSENFKQIGQIAKI